MPQRADTVTDPEGRIWRDWVDVASGVVLQRECLAAPNQPEKVRRMEEARDAGLNWHLLREALDNHVAGGLAYWQQIAPTIGLPSTQGAYDTATTFLTDRRDKAWARFVRLLNEARVAP